MNVANHCRLSLRLFIAFSCLASGLAGVLGQTATPPQPATTPATATSAQTTTDDVDVATKESIIKFLDELLGDFNGDESQNNSRYVAWADTAATIRAHHAPLKFVDSPEKMQEVMERHWTTALDAWQPDFYWSRHKILKLEKQDEQTYLVTVRHYQELDEVYLKLRWTLKRQADQSWRFADILDIECNVSVTALLAVLVAPNEDQVDWLMPMKQWLLSVNDKTFFDDELNPSLEVLDAIDNLLDLQPPKSLQAYLLVLKISMQMMGEDAAQANVDLHNLDQLPGDYAIANYFRGSIHMNNEDYSAAIEQYAKYAESTTWDPDVSEMVADCYYNLGDADRAVDYALRGLNDEFDAIGCLATLAVALPDEKKSELNTWFEKNKFDEQILTFVIDWALTNDDQAAAGHVFGILESKHPRSPAVKELRMLIDRRPAMGPMAR